MDVLVCGGGGVGDGERVDAEFLAERGKGEVDVLAWVVGFLGEGFGKGDCDG